MPFDQRGLDDYVDVATRIAEFRDAYPDGRLRPADPADPFRIVQVEGFDKGGDMIHQTFVVVVAAAYRDAGDTAPGIGMAWEVFPGRTPYTRGSELMNAETSAWGRAIVATLASDSRKGVASREEVRNRQAERDDGLPANRDGSISRSRATDEQLEAAGAMTRPQLRDHNALRRDGEPPPERVEKFAGPPPGEDTWQIPEDQLGSASNQQELDIVTEYSRLGVHRREDRLADVGARAGRVVKSSRELSMTEAIRVLASLREEATPDVDAGV